MKSADALDYQMNVHPRGKVDNLVMRMIIAHQFNNSIWLKIIPSNNRHSKGYVSNILKPEDVLHSI